MSRNKRPITPLGMKMRALIYVGLFAVTACDMFDMYQQPKVRPLSKSDFFSDGRGARTLVEGTVARGQLHADSAFETGKIGGKWVEHAPIMVGWKEITHGQQRFNIYCSVCHDRTGSGRGMIVQRGFRQPPSLHLDRLRHMPDGYFFDVMTNGFATMPSYASQIPVEDRWHIVTYVRALQLSQHASLSELPQGLRQKWFSQKNATGGTP